MVSIFGGQRGRRCGWSERGGRGRTLDWRVGSQTVSALYGSESTRLFCLCLPRRSCASHPPRAAWTSRGSDSGAGCLPHPCWLPPPSHPFTCSEKQDWKDWRGRWPPLKRIWSQKSLDSGPGSTA
ncbi:hypothetical protein HJG60_007860 [Phyllostomus discolor]|uniref:Uncharacterized protein n=1 Tax=Phyllostomus discolor TaxID=89673 RepID=A0A834BMS9_9CHIR|nr:hypothetical protein HJG60_007860 [Phyllostomus discolor]